MKYDNDTLKIMSLFEKVTRARLKDFAIHNNFLIFIVQKGQAGKAIGKEKSNVKNLEEKLGKKVKIVEYNEDVEKFIKNLLFPLKATEIKQEGSIVHVKGPDQKTRGLMIGAKAQNLRFYESIAKKYFDIEEIKIS